MAHCGSGLRSCCHPGCLIMLWARLSIPLASTTLTQKALPPHCTPCCCCCCTSFTRQTCTFACTQAWLKLPTSRRADHTAGGRCISAAPIRTQHTSPARHTPYAGVIARQRKNEVEELNERLRKINLSLRQQARVSTMYAPGLTYAPRDVDSAPSDSEQGAGPSVSSASTATFNWQPLVSCSLQGTS